MLPMKWAMAAYRLTPRDEQIAAWLARVPWAEVSHVARRFQMHEAKAYERLRALRSAGHCDHVRIWHGRPGAYFAGRRPSPREYEHGRAVVAALVAFELSGHAVTTELEMRRDEAFAGERRWSIALGRGADGRERFHRPDLVLDDAVAVELELAAKGRARLERLLAAHVRLPRYARVVYLVPEGARQTAAALERLAAQAGGRGLIEVRVGVDMLRRNGEERREAA
jgi:hypothetical protein